MDIKRYRLDHYFIKKIAFKTRGNLSLTGGFFIDLILGTTYLLGSISVYVASYYHYFGTNSEITTADISIILPFIFTAFGSTMVPGLLLSKKIGYRLNCMIMSVIIAASIFFSIFFKEFWGFAMFYGIIFGLC